MANPSADLYGSDRMMLESVRGLVGLGWRVVVTCSDAGPLLLPLQTAGAEIRIEPVPVLRKSMLNPKGVITLLSQAVRSVPRMRRMLRDERPDVVLVNTLTIPLWLLVGRLARRPVVVHVHEAERSLARPKRLALTAPLALAAMVIYNSEIEPAGVRTAPAGASRPDPGHPQRRARAGPGQSGSAEPRRGPFRLVYIGRLSPRKGVDLILTAARQLTDDGVRDHGRSRRFGLSGLRVVRAAAPGAGTRPCGSTSGSAFHGFQEHGLALPGRPPMSRSSRRGWTSPSAMSSSNRCWRRGRWWPVTTPA